MIDQNFENTRFKSLKLGLIWVIRYRYLCSCTNLTCVSNVAYPFREANILQNKGEHPMSKLVMEFNANNAHQKGFEQIECCDSLSFYRL